MIDKLEWEKCCLCQACSAACPTHSISFTKEQRGFYYPNINETTCINCNKCEHVCPVLNELQNEKKEISVSSYALKCETEIRKKSTSGGAFYAFADEILKKDGYVCGVVLDSQLQAVHIVSDRRRDIEQMMGSKYIQSDMSEAYRIIRQQLENEKPVLFTGCPCQVAGLRSYLGKEYAQLFLVELICHGAPSSIAFQSYKKMLEQRYQSVVKEIKFREKTNGWHMSRVWCLFENGKQYSKQILFDSFMKGFLGGILNKECCYDCQFKAFKAGADLVIGDFWGAEVVLKEMDDNVGISSVIVLTDKGKKLIRDVEETTEIKKVKTEDIIHYNRNVMESLKKNEKRDEFFAMAGEKGYEATFLHYLDEGKKEVYRRELRLKAKKIFYKLSGKDEPLY